MGGLQGPQDTSYGLMHAAVTRAVNIVRADPAVQNVVAFTGDGMGSSNGGFMFIALKPLNERKISSTDVVNRLRPKLMTIEEAQYNTDVVLYRQTVLTAFKELEDYLVSSRLLTDRSQRQKLAIEASARYAKIAETRYKSGIDTYLNVITAQNTLLTNQQTLATAQTNQMVAAVELIAALGGGWDTSQMPSVSDMKQKPK